MRRLVYPHATVLHLHRNDPQGCRRGAHDEHAVPILHLVHGLEGIAQQVQEHLTQLEAVPVDQGEIVSQGQRDQSRRCAAASRCTSPMVSRTTSLILRRVKFLRPGGHKRLQLPHHLVGAAGVRDNIGQGRARFLQIRRVEGEQMPGRLGVAEHGRQGLLDLVGQDSEFPQAVGGEGRRQLPTLLSASVSAYPCDARLVDGGAPRCCGAWEPSGDVSFSLVVRGMRHADTSV